MVSNLISCNHLQQTWLISGSEKVYRFGVLCLSSRESLLMYYRSTSTTAASAESTVFVLDSELLSGAFCALPRLDLKQLTLLHVNSVAARNSRITPSIKVRPGDATKCVEDFRMGKINVLVATSVIEEVSDSA